MSPVGRGGVYGNNAVRFGRPCPLIMPDASGQKYNMPDVWILDLWPVADRFLFIRDPVISSDYTVC
jgi:hypothetical protein